MTISSIPPSLAAQLAPTTNDTTTTATQAAPTTPAAPKYTPAEVVENFVASVESNAITEILGGGTDSGASGLAGLLGGATGAGSTPDLASLLGGSTGDGSTSELASLLGGPNASTSVSDPTGLASIASAYDLARSSAALGVNPFDQSATQAAVGSTVDASA
jgi:hypothetical protein